MILAATAAISACNSTEQKCWTDEEKNLINGAEELMRVLTVDDAQDSLVLRKACVDLSAEEIASDTYKKLAELMVATVTSPEQDGVGIAGPQVGISRRVVAVQRFDKEGEPFEVYPNARIIGHNGEMEAGAEGCLSVPGKRGNVMRWQDIDLQYTSPLTLKDTVENIKGFTAVIFQHETDHLDGVIYTDKTIAEE